MPSSEEGRRQYLEAARERGLRMIADGAPLRSVLTHLAATVAALAQGEVVASILLLDREGLLRNGASPNLPADYLDAIDRLKPDPDVGTCAAAAATGQIVLTPDFTADARWSELRHLPMSLGFAGAWSQPIKAESGRVLGTFGTYFRVRREPTAQERETVGLLAVLAAQAIAASPSYGAPAS
jgi:GAF domain-containing protein